MPATKSLPASRCRWRSRSCTVITLPLAAESVTASAQMPSLDRTAQSPTDTAGVASLSWMAATAIAVPIGAFTGFEQA